MQHMYAPSPIQKLDVMNEMLIYTLSPIKVIFTIGIERKSTETFVLHKQFLVDIIKLFIDKRRGNMNEKDAISPTIPYVYVCFSFNLIAYPSCGYTYKPR